MEKYKSKFEEGNFNKRDFSKVMDRPIMDLYTAFTEVESTSNHYLKKSGQGGAISAFRKQYLDPLTEAIQNLEKGID